MRGVLAALLVSLLSPGPVVADDLLQVGQPVQAIEPTPTGDGHLGQLESGAAVQTRFLLPAEVPMRFGVRLGNVVAYTGKGSSYRLVLRRDAADGAVVHEGLEEADGDRWNALNREPIDLTAAVTADDCRRGYLDIYVSATVTGDGWTLYRSQERRPIGATVVERDPKLMAALAAAKAAAARDVAVIPWPTDLTIDDGDLALAATSRIVLAGPVTEDDRFAAGDLAEQLRETTGMSLKVVAPPAAAGDVVLERVAQRLPGGDEAYRVRVSDRVQAAASGAAGLFYAAATIGQLVRENGTLPRCRIDDQPAYPLRGLQYDVARGQTVEVEWWQRVLKLLARCKLNAVMIYGEDDYGFQRFPFLGRPGTFTPEKAKVLTDFARRYHVQLIPQFESLGHASAVLRHEELAPLREKGGAWVFCTSTEATWTFLDQVFAELAEQFPDSRYLHVGADEFEHGFGKCDACAAKVARVGLGGLYAEHMNRLDALCRKHGRTMLFWPSHAGPTPELSWMTVQNEKALRKDCIPTEWIYHGPDAYPQLQQYQELGFQDVWASPSVVCYRSMVPDYSTTFRGIRGFLAAGHERGIGGCMTTTWEWMDGCLVSNSLLGMVYAAECGWSLGNTPVSDYERRFGRLVYGLRGVTGEQVHETLAVPWPRSMPGAVLFNQRLLGELCFAPLATVRRTYTMRMKFLADPAPLIAVVDQALERLQKLTASAGRNRDLLDYQRATFLLLRYGLRRLAVLDEAARAYRQAAKQTGADRVAALAGLRDAAGTVRRLNDELGFAELYRRAVKQMGAYAGDVTRMDKMAPEHEALAKRIDDLAAELEAGKSAALPPGSALGLDTGRTVLVGEWTPDKMSETPVEIRFPVPAAALAAGALVVDWQYTRGAHGLVITDTKLLRNGQQVAVDTHRGWAGAGSSGNTYRLTLDAVDPTATYELAGTVASHGGTDSRGEVWLVIEEP